MKINIQTTVWITLVGGMLLLAPAPGFADDSVESLKQQVAALQAKVAALETQSKKANPDQADPFLSADQGWDPFYEMERMHTQMNRMFQQAWAQPSSPQQGMFSNQLFFDESQLEKTKDGYRLTLNTEGFDPDNINIRVQDHALSISGEYRNEQTRQDPNQVFASHNFGKFLNTVPLPADADETKMTTEKSDGHLDIFFPRKAGVI